MSEKKRNKREMKAINLVNYESIICWEQVAFVRKVFKVVIYTIAMILYSIEGVQMKPFVANDYHFARQIAEQTYTEQETIRIDDFYGKIRLDGKIKVVVRNKGYILYDFSVEPMEIKVVNKSIVKSIIKNLIFAIVTYLLVTLVLEVTTMSFIALRVKDEEQREKRKEILKERTMEEKMRIFQKRGNVWNEIKYHFIDHPKEKYEEFYDEENEENE